VKMRAFILAFANSAKKEPRHKQTRRGFRLVTSDVARKFQTRIWTTRKTCHPRQDCVRHFAGFRPRDNAETRANFSLHFLGQLRGRQMRPTQSAD